MSTAGLPGHVLCMVRAVMHPLRISMMTVLVGLFSLGCGANESTSQPQALHSDVLRNADWMEVFAEDPRISIHESDIPPLDDYIVVQLETGTYTGIPILAPHFGDIDGDGMEEAAIVLVSGGTAGGTGYLIYREREGSPSLVAADSGYQLSADIKGGALVVHESSFVGFEPNCCPSAVIQTRYHLSGDVLVEIGREVFAQPVQRSTVQAFYVAFNSHDLRRAYSFLNVDQSEEAFAAWAVGYANTWHVEVATRETADPDVIQIDLTVIDDIDGQQQTAHYTGTWSLVFSEEQERWLLDEADIVQVH